MFDNFLLISIVIIIFWLGALVYYLYVSRQQQTLEDELQSLQRKLEQNGDDVD